MAADNSFDITSKIDLQEVDNAINQAAKEIGQRYDFKGSLAEIERQGNALILKAQDEYKLKAITEILSQRLAGRHVPLKGLSFKPPESAMGGTLRQEIELQQGIAQDQAKEIVKLLKGSGLKVQAAIQGDQVRVRARSRDLLQSAISLLKDSPLDFDMQFTNYR